MDVLYLEMIIQLTIVHLLNSSDLEKKKSRYVSKVMLTKG